MIGAFPRADQDFTIHDYVPGQPIPALIRDPQSGKIVVNELKRYVKPFTLTTEPASLTLAANAQSDPIPMVLDAKGHFEIHQGFFSSSQSAGFTVTLFDPQQRMLLMNRELHVSTIAAGGGAGGGSLPVLFSSATSGGRAFRWPTTLWMETTSGTKVIFAVFRNLSSSPNAIRFALHGLRWYHAQAPVRIAERMEQIYRGRLRTAPFFYTTERDVNLSASASGAFDIRFGDESWTEWIKGAKFTTNGGFTVRIIEKTTGKRLMDEPLRDDLVFGDGEFPMLNWESSLFEPNYKLTCELTNLNTEAANRIFLTLACRKILFDPHEDRLLRPGETPGR